MVMQVREHHRRQHVKAIREDARSRDPESLEEAHTPTELCDAAAERIRKLLSADFVGVQLQIDTQNCHRAVGNSEWSPLAHGLMQRVRGNGRPIVRMLDESSDKGCAAVAVPMHLDGQLVGCTTAIVPCPSAVYVGEFLRNLEKLSRQVEAAAGRVSGAVQAAEQQPTRPLAMATGYSCTEEMAYAIANGLRAEVNAEVVAVGMVFDGRVSLVCVSGVDEVKQDTPGNQKMIASMEEAVDSARTLCVQPSDLRNRTPQSDGHVLTTAWQQHVGDSPVASVPLIDSNGTCVAVVSVQGRTGHVMTSDDLRQIERLTGPLTPAIRLMKSADRGVFRHMSESASTLVKKITGGWGILRTISVCGSCCLAGWMIFGTTDYIVRAPCTIVAAHSQHVAAPMEAALSQVFVKPGDLVQEGQLLGRMDTRLLDAEFASALAEKESARIAVARAAQQSEPSEIGRAVSQFAMAEAELARVSRLLESAELKSPCSGQVISADLTKRSGETMPIGEPLFEIVPDGQLVVEAEIPESMVTYVQPGQSCRFTMNSQPAHSQACRMERIDASMAARESGKIVAGRAVIEDRSSWLRPGMQGVVRISTGLRPVWWTWLHRSLDTVRYGVWSMTGAGDSQQGS